MKSKLKKIQNTNPKHLVWNFLIFEHLDLFRISDFEFGPFFMRSLAPWRPVGVTQGMLCASHAVSDAGCRKYLFSPSTGEMKEGVPSPVKRLCRNREKCTTVILSKAKNLILPATYQNEILRLSPQG